MADIIKVKEVSKISENKRYDAAFKKEIAQVYQSAKILHHKICELLGGEEKMENINRLFHQRFLLTTPIAGYLQGLTTETGRPRGWCFSYCWMTLIKRIAHRKTANLMIAKTRIKTII
jgi:hypothetical protein